MNYILFFSVMNMILLSRLYLTLRDEGTTDVRSRVIMALIPFPVLIFFELNTGFLLLFMYLALSPWLTGLLERDARNLNRNRFILLLIHTAIIALLTSRLYNLNPVSWIYGFENYLIEMFTPGGEGEHQDTDWLAIQAVLFGFLIILNEANIMVRLMLTRLGLSPVGNKGQVINEQEYRTGRVIGFLERIFVFIFILLQQYAAVGFILAAKGIVRYPDFGNRTFAEYILIGTLLSALFATMFAFLAQAFF
ncbi:hypothetical protein [Rhodohalobacter mucosus]|uniref:Uncharacterized protein n=1 Tax=Rhodohalobacter mucosus TaxID=2079485 RepID=A0A316TS68_9BACT|nr:hypothetical protein [Rhodohalobacter mucosus]PWN06159.1 hypothetical protein DDZ15_09960 [Rhodohalobacter mucosus]